MRFVLWVLSLMNRRLENDLARVERVRQTDEALRKVYHERERDKVRKIADQMRATEPPVWP